MQLTNFGTLHYLAAYIFLIMTSRLVLVHVIKKQIQQFLTNAQIGLIFFISQLSITTLLEAIAWLNY